MRNECEQEAEPSFRRGGGDDVKCVLLPVRRVVENVSLRDILPLSDSAKSFIISTNGPAAGNNHATNSRGIGITSRHFPETPAVAGQKGGKP